MAAVESLRTFPKYSHSVVWISPGTRDLLSCHRALEAKQVTRVSP